LGHFSTATGRLSIKRLTGAPAISNLIPIGGGIPVYDEDLTNLEEWLRRLKIEYFIFFSGNRKKPPDDLRIRVERLVKKLSECSDMSLSQRFRYTTLITRFYVYRDLWRRMLQGREMGEEPKSGEASAPGASSQPSRLPVEAVRISISDPATEEEKVRMLYEALLRIRRTDSQESPLPYQQFVKYIATRTRSIREKYGCSKVAFTIALEEDAIRFTAAAENR
jgi:hypothetical protein